MHLFMVVPVGCGLELAATDMLPAGQHERVLQWFDDESKSCPIDLKATSAIASGSALRPPAVRIQPHARGGERDSPDRSPPRSLHQTPDIGGRSHTPG